MTAPSSRILAVLLLASYGLISAFGNGLHALGDGWHGGSASNCSSEGHQPTPEPPTSDHSDCLICHVVGQDQLPVLSVPLASEPAEIGQVIATRSIFPRQTDRLCGDPRAPPAPLC